MRTTVTIDDDLMKDAQEFSGIKEKSALINEALRWFVAREAGKRLARLGGTMPDLEYTPRRRPPNFMSSESTYPEMDSGPSPKRRAR
jgi:Arc/MetJ family transcription regulator